jgi:hypothetical protein
MNGIPTDRSLVFETLKNEKIKIKTYHFAEKQKQITANIFRSKSIVADAPLAASVGPPASERPLSLPPSATELSLQIKKKRDLIKEIDLRAVAKGQRGASIERTAELLEAEIVSLCPRTAGYRCSRKRYRPFKEWRDIFGIRLFVRRGLFDGYEIQVEPKDSECRQLSISICASNLISDLRRYASMALAAVFVMISLKWSYVVQYWLGDFAELTPLVMLAIFVGAVGISTGLLQLPIHLLRLLMSDQQRAEAQKQGIKIGIQKMTI